MQGLYRDMCHFGGLFEKEILHLSQSWQNMWRDVMPERKNQISLIETILTEDVELADNLVVLGNTLYNSDQMSEKERNQMVSKIQKRIS